MSRNRPDFRKAMAQVLSSKGVATINFTVKGFRVHSASYAKIRKLIIDTGKINIEFDSVKLASCYPPADASYNGTTDTFTFETKLETQSTLETWDWAVIVHESTHAIFDMARVSSLNHVEEDVAARLAEELFYVTQFDRFIHYNMGLMELHNAVVKSPGMEITTHPSYPDVVRWVMGLGYSSSRMATHDGI